MHPSPDFCNELRKEKVKPSLLFINHNDIFRIA
jgi:hypothetical protein